MLRPRALNACARVLRVCMVAKCMGFSCAALYKSGRAAPTNFAQYIFMTNC